MLRAALAVLGIAFAMLVAGAPGRGGTSDQHGGQGAPARPLLMPVSGAVLTQPFGCTSLAIEPLAPGCVAGHFHSGIDLAAGYSTPVLAAAPGTARVADDPGGYGLYVTIDHGGGLTTLYGHLETATVRTGSAVAAGQQIGLMGSSGLSTGPHLHFEARQYGRPLDPMPYLEV